MACFSLQECVLCDLLQGRISIDKQKIQFINLFQMPVKACKMPSKMPSKDACTNILAAKNTLIKYTISAELIDKLQTFQNRSAQKLDSHNITMIIKSFILLRKQLR